MPTGEHIVTLVNCFNWWIEIDFVRSTSSQVITKFLDSPFCQTQGTLQTDNGTMPSGHKIGKSMEQSSNEMGNKHTLTTPRRTRANEEVERQKRSLLQTIRMITLVKGGIEKWTQQFLVVYRLTPHTATGKSPVSCYLGEELPQIQLSREIVVHFLRNCIIKFKKEMRKRESKLRICKQITERDIGVGNLLPLEKEKASKLSSCYEQDPHQIVARHGASYSYYQWKELCIKKNIQHVKRFVSSY